MLLLFRISRVSPRIFNILFLDDQFNIRDNEYIYVYQT